MIIRSILFALAGAVFAALLNYRDFSILLGIFLGLALAEYLRLNTSVKQLQSRLESLETLDNLQPQKPMQPTPATADLKTRSDAAPPQFGPRSEAEPAAGNDSAVAAKPQAVAASQQLPARATVLAQAAKARRNRTPKALQQFLDRFSTTTRIGIVVLFFGVSFLLKYAADRGVFPIEFRLVCVLALGLGIYQIGRKLQPRERNYGLLLRGAGIGIWYLTCYAAASLYHLIGANLSFAFLVALSAFTAWNAVRHNTRALAIFGIVGGFLAPILMSSGEGSHVVLFTYYAVVNAGIVGIAYRQTWRELPTIGFLFTFVIGALWGATSYRPEYFSSTEPFLLLSAAFYMAVPLLFANQVQHGKLPLYSNLIVFGTPAIAFALQLLLVADFHHGDTYSALLFGTAYAAVLLVLWQRLGSTAPLLRDAMVGIAVVFFTLAIAFAFDQKLAGALWAIEAAGGVWLSTRQQRKWGCYLCLLILGGSGALWSLDMPAAGERLLLNTASLQIAVIALSGLVIAFLLDAQRRLLGEKWVFVAAAWAAVWWLGGGIWQITYHLPANAVLNALGVFVLCSSAALMSLYLFTQRSLAGYLTGFSMHLLAAIGLAAAAQNSGPLHQLGAFAWPATIIYLYLATYLLTSSSYLLKVGGITYVFAATLVLAIGLAEFYPWFTAIYPSPAGKAIAVTLPLLIAFWLLQLVSCWRREFDQLHRATLTGAAVALLIFAFVSGLFIPPAIVTESGGQFAWPINLLQIAVLLSIARWWQRSDGPFTAGRARDQGWLALGVSAFVLANVLLLRFIHLHQEVPFAVMPLFKDDTVQTTISVFWTVVGVIAVMWSSRHAHSTLWHVGMGLLAVVVAKLFLVDLAQSGTVERIVSFIAVGLLLMTVGWKSPRPPRTSAAHTSAGKPRASDPPAGVPQAASPQELS